MKSIPPAVQSALNASQHLTVRQCADFYLMNGSDLRRWTTSPTDITVEGDTYLAKRVLWTCSDLTAGLLSRDDKTELELMDVEGGGFDVIRAAQALTFHGQRVVLWTVYLDDTGTVLGKVKDFDGYVQEVRPLSTKLKLTVRSPSAKAGEQIPRTLVAAGCGYTLYGPECGASQVTGTGTLAAGCTPLVLQFSGPLPSAANVGGWVTINTGPLAGITAKVAKLSGVSVTLAQSLGAAPAGGVTVTFLRGCAKTRADCAFFNRKLYTNMCPDAPVDSVMAEG